MHLSADVSSAVHSMTLERTFSSLIRNAKGVVAAANKRKPQSFVKGGNHRANRKLSMPRRENLQISYVAPFLPSCHYNQGTMCSLHLESASSSLPSLPLALFPSLPSPASTIFLSHLRPTRLWIRASEHLISTQFRWLESTYKPTVLLRGNYRLQLHRVLFESPAGLLICRITSRRV